MINKEQIEPDEIETVVTNNFADFDDHRIEGLTDLSIFQESKGFADERNLSRLQKKYGDTHPLVQATQAKIESNFAIAAEIKGEILRTRTPVPAGNAETWTIHGYVFDENKKAVPNAPVMIFDESGEMVSRSDKTTTNANGYFRLPLKSIKNLPETVRVGVSNEFIGFQVFTPELGEVDYAEIFVRGEIFEIPPCEPTETPTVETIPTGQNFSDWLVTGKITDARGKGIADLKVRVFDRDLLFDDALGVAETNSEGVYRLTFTKDQFSDFGENYPELYLIVEDAAGNQLFDGKRDAKTRAGRIELIDIQLKERNDKKQ